MSTKNLGRYTAVIDLSCVMKISLCIQCEWSPPFSLIAEIPNYTIDIINNNDTTLHMLATDANITYCPSQYGQYSIGVAANNTVGLGSVAYAIVNFSPTGI